MTTMQRQNLLQYLGYYTGKVDGLWGSMSGEAARQFQKDNGISSTGICDDKTDELLKSAVFYDKLKGAKVAVEAPAIQESFWSTAKHFGRHEFACKCGKCGGYPVEPAEALVRFLDKFRDKVGLPVYINSGIRCKTHNASVGGASSSRHLCGDAADIRCPGKTPKELYDLACEMLPNGGVGIYTWGIHVDTRGYKARW